MENQDKSIKQKEIISKKKLLEAGVYFGHNKSI
jgi:ribosomal protein S2